MSIVELSFPLRGTPLPYDNGYRLYQAVAGIVPWLREPAQVDLAIVPIQGTSHGGFIHLTRGSRLRFRLNAGDVAMLQPLAEQRLVVDAATLRLGRPTEFRLRPAPGLMSLFVVAEYSRHSAEFLDWVRQQLRNLDIKAVPALRRQRGRDSANSPEGNQRSFDSPYARHRRQIGDNSVVGWEVQIFGLTPEESVRLQEHGVGPGRRYGCGVFVPSEERRPRPRHDATGVWFPET
jgi:CRISPR-associated protein Cas6